MKSFFYRVQKGDTVFSLCVKFQLNISTLKKDNALYKEIEEGDVLFIQTNDGYKIKPEDTLSSLSEKFNVSEEEILSKNGIPYVFYGLTITL